MEELKLKKIATIRNGYGDKFGVPRQSGLVDAMESVIVFEKEYRDAQAVRGIEKYSHLWLIWHFSKVVRQGWRPTVRPPRLGGNTRMGVFATRSPFRPNPIGLSSVRLIGVEKTDKDGVILRVAGADLADGTPIFDIKPYLSYTDSHEDAVCGFADSVQKELLAVECSDRLKARVTEREYEVIAAVLEQDPRPSYIEDKERIYAADICKKNVKFKVSDGVLTIVDIK